jgi:hypothetical protein
VKRDVVTILSLPALVLLLFMLPALPWIPATLLFIAGLIVFGRIYGTE